MSNEYVLAMYDVRGKQQFIYRSQYLKEIIGGSWIIRDVFEDYLYVAAKEVRYADAHASDETLRQEPDALYVYEVQQLTIPQEKRKSGKALREDGREAEFVDGIEQFNYQQFVARMDAVPGQYLGEVIYDGGGNFFVLYKNADICRRVTAAFTRRVLENIGTLEVICSYIVGIDPADYNKDQRKLYNVHRYTESQEAPIAPYGTLPIVQVDYLTSMPLTTYRETVGGEAPKAVSKEAGAKYTKYAQGQEAAQRRENARPEGERQIPDEKILDNLLPDEREDSLLAVIYIDGNNMGDKVSKITRKEDGTNASYEECVNGLREFSRKIQHTFIDGRSAGIDQATRNYSRKTYIDDKGRKRALRQVVGSGDEITIITDAHAAYQVACSYLKELADIRNEADPEERWNSCAGISVFHSHAPFADAYRIAEEACETGKRYMKQQAIRAEQEMKDAETRGDKAIAEQKRAEHDAWQNACMLDFHYNQGTIDSSLEDIRRVEGIREESDGARLWTPWMIYGPQAGDTDVEIRDVRTMQEILNRFGRSNTKGLLQAARESRGRLTMEVRRICAHMQPREAAEFESKGYLNYLYAGGDKDAEICDKARMLMIRMIPVYDIWFRKEDER